MNSLYLLSPLVLAVALAVGLYTYSAAKRLRILEERVKTLEKLVETLARHNKLVARAALSALRSTEAEEFLSRLRAKRRRRYIAFYIVYEGGEPPPPQDVERAIIRAVERLSGQLAVALGRIQLVYYDPEKSVGIVRCSHDTKYIVLAAMGIIRRIGKRKAVIIPVRTSGTIKRAKKALPA